MKTLCSCNLWVQTKISGVFHLRQLGTEPQKLPQIWPWYTLHGTGKLHIIHQRRNSNRFIRCFINRMIVFTPKSTEELLTEIRWWTKDINATVHTAHAFIFIIIKTVLGCQLSLFRSHTNRKEGFEKQAENSSKLVPTNEQKNSLWSPYLFRRARVCLEENF